MYELILALMLIVLAVLWLVILPTCLLGLLVNRYPKNDFINGSNLVINPSLCVFTFLLYLDKVITPLQ